MTTATELLRRIQRYIGNQYLTAETLELSNDIDDFLAAEPEAEPVALKHRLLQIHDALESHLGGSDSCTLEDMTDEEIREEDLVFWAAKEVANLIGDAPWDQYLHPPRPELEPLNAAILPNGSTATNVYEAYEEGLKEGSRRNGYVFW